MAMASHYACKVSVKSSLLNTGKPSNYRPTIKHNTTKYMKITTQLNHIQRLESRVNSIISAGTCYLSSHSDLLERIKKEVYEDKGFSKLPSHAKQRIYSLVWFRFEHIGNNLTIWAFLCDGLPVQYDDMTKEQKEKFAHVSNHSGHRFWLKEITPRGGRTWFEQKDGIFSRSYKLTEKIWS